MESFEKVDALIVGAGLIGLAVARKLAITGRSVIVIERNTLPVSETSSRNSGVIHSGIYYAPGSIKARVCVRGRDLLYAYCEARGIPHRRCGKLILAQDAEIGRLEDLLDTANANGVTDLQWVDRDAVRQQQPQLVAAAGLWSPSTGIVSVHELAEALQADIEGAGGVIAFRSELIDAQRRSDGFRVGIRCEEELLRLDCVGLVNAAGLAAIPLLSRIDGYPSARIPAAFFAKGSYFEFSGRSPFSQLVYPMPSPGGLGIHATIDMGGQLRFGPDVEWLTSGDDPIDYSVSGERAFRFYDAIRHYWPSLPDGSLRPSYAGVRPKLVGEGSMPADFRIESQADHSIPGLVNLLGIESPGLTSSLAIGDYVSELLFR